MLRWVLNIGGQQNCPGAGAESRLGADKGAKLFQKAAFGQEIQKCAGFSAGNDDAINVIKLFRFAYQRDHGAQLFEPSLVGCVVTLDGKNTDGHCFLSLRSKPL